MDKIYRNLHIFFCYLGAGLLGYSIGSSPIPEFHLWIGIVFLLVGFYPEFKKIERIFR